MIDININKYLLLDDEFVGSNIDLLNKKALEASDLNERLSLLTMATEKIEKFHSYFHFEQSYFHLQLALLNLQNNDEMKAAKQLELAIFQDHLNYQAKNVNADKEYKRPYERFIDYLVFATENKELSYVTEFDSYSHEDADVSQFESSDNFWLYWLYCQQNKTEETLEKLIAKIRYHHQNYHAESAKLYLNRAITFRDLGQIELARNDIVKARNLDDSVSAHIDFGTKVP